MAEATIPAVESPQEEIKVATGKKRALVSDQLPDKVHTWPYLVRAEFISGCVLILGLTLWTVLIDAPLEEPSNPSKTPNPSKAPWYFLGLQEMLVYFDPWIAGVVLPSLIIVGLMVIPYVDINPNGNGYYTFKERPFAILTFFLGFLVLWVGFVTIGVFFRGPGWNLYMLGSYWDPHKVVAMTNQDLPYLLGARSELSQWLIGAGCLAAWFGLPIALWGSIRNRPVMKQLGFARYAIVSFLFQCMSGVVVKIILRLTLSVKYVWVWKNIWNI